MWSLSIQPYPLSMGPKSFPVVTQSPERSVSDVSLSAEGLTVSKAFGVAVSAIFALRAAEVVVKVADVVFSSTDLALSAAVSR